jgi:hypothetical protein
VHIAGCLHRHRREHAARCKGERRQAPGRPGLRALLPSSAARCKRGRRQAPGRPGLRALLPSSAARCKRGRRQVRR